ncbi:MAG TPA: hypothetical protein VGI40_07305 [Pirellulaceae bacterium]|jgi:hypothetical protein
MRFTIRDLLWLMVVVGLACGWGASEYRWRQRDEEKRVELNKALNEADFLKFGRMGGVAS